MSLFDFFQNSFFKQEQKRNRQLYGRQAVCEDMEAELCINSVDDVEDERQSDIWRNDYACECQDECDYVNECDYEEVY